MSVVMPEFTVEAEDIGRGFFPTINWVGCRFSLQFWIYRNVVQLAPRILVFRNSSFLNLETVLVVDILEQNLVNVNFVFMLCTTCCQHDNVDISVSTPLNCHTRFWNLQWNPLC
jgi:hypothetical protein